MVSERKRAEALGYPSPIHDTLHDTHTNYDAAVAQALSAMAQGGKVEVLIASHNQVSRRLILLQRSYHSYLEILSFR